MKSIAIIIVNWNGWKDTVACIRSIQAMDKKMCAVSIVVVDNGSTDESVSKISKALPQGTILTLPKNLGFTGGNNEGMKYATLLKTEYIWLLNNDTLVHKNALDIVEAFSDPTVGISGSKIYFAPGHEYHRSRYKPSERGKVFWYAGGLIDWKNMLAAHRGVDEVDVGQYDAFEDTPFVTGCSMMVRRKVIETIGYLDNAYYLYLEDVDYCVRAKKAGFRTVYNPASVIWHINAGSSGGAGNPLHDYYISRNRLLLGMKFASLRTKVALLREAFSFFRRDNKEKKRAVIDFLTGKFGKQYEPKH